MKKLLIKFLCFSLISNYLLNTEKIYSLTPYYYLPSKKNLERESQTIGQYAYQLLYFGQIKDSLNLAKLAVKINKFDYKLWLILSEAQISNQFYEEALIALSEAQKIKPNLSEIYFAKSTIYIKQSKFTEAKLAIRSGLKIKPNNHKALFDLGNIYLMEKDYSSAIKVFDEAINIKSDFWQAINNKGLVYFEQDKINLSMKFFKQAISIEENAEPLLGLAACLSNKDINKAIALAQKALNKDPKYLEYNYRKEQLWGEKLQTSTEKLLKMIDLKKIQPQEN